MSDDDTTTSGESLWGHASSGESRWPAAIAVAAALVLQILLPNKLTPGPRYVVPALELVLLIGIMIANPSRLTAESRDVRFLSITLIGLVNAANLASLVLLVHHLLSVSNTNGHALILAGAGVWMTFVIVFGLWFWEFDRGGPLARSSPDHSQPDFLFPQMENPGLTRGHWSPTFIDYLYVSLTNATAFSPTDTMPLTRRAKVLMGIHGVASLATIAVVGARAVNILG